MITKETYLKMKKLIEEFENKPSVSEEQPPYFYIEKIKVKRKYNPEYGDSRYCKCGHQYYRHFDTYENMCAVGCKYCGCCEFEEA